MSHQLINFNIPTGLKDALDEIAKAKRLSRTAIINQLLEGYCRSALQEPAIQPNEPRRVCRRLISISYAAMALVSRAA